MPAILTPIGACRTLSIMTKNLFLATMASYWICFLLRLLGSPKVTKKIVLLERTALLVFTAALVFYISKLQVIGAQLHSETYDRPVSLLLLVWSLSVAHLVTEVVYGNQTTALFVNFCTALALNLSAAIASFFPHLFTHDLNWLSFHRLCFLFGYAFCILALPLVFQYFWLSCVQKPSASEEAGARQSRLWRLDRMAYRLVLWALPLLTAGIITEALVLLENHQLPDPADLWRVNKETVLALATWFLCGIYLHTRLFFGWKNQRSAILYLAGLVLLLVGHFSQAVMS